MPSLLHLDSSADLLNSRSRAITAAVAEAWTARGADFTIVRRDLHRDPPPHLVASALHWRPEERLPEEEALPEAEAYQRLLIDELLAADAVVVGAPLYNFSMASTLKAWIDHIHVGGVTTVDADGAGPLAGRPVVIATSSGIGYDVGSPTEGWAHAVPPLRVIFENMLGMTVEVIGTSYTLAERSPELAEHAERSRAELAAALERGAELGRTLAA